MGIIKAFKKANQTVNEVQSWGRDTTAYEQEQREKRGETKPAPANNKQGDKK